MKQSKNQVSATKSNIYEGKDSPSGDPVHQTDNESSEGALTVRRAPESWGSAVTEALQRYCISGKIPSCDTQMEDLVYTMLPYSIWGDGGGKDFGSGFKSLLCS